MKESEYVLVSDLASARAAERVLSDINSRSKDLTEILLRLRAYIAREHISLGIISTREKRS